MIQFSFRRRSRRDRGSGFGDLRVRREGRGEDKRVWSGSETTRRLEEGGGLVVRRVDSVNLCKFMRLCVCTNTMKGRGVG